MKFFPLSIILLFFSCIQIVQADVKNIKICTPVWEYYTQKDGTGLYHDLWRLIFQPAGITLDIKYAPFKRCANAVNEKKSADYDVLTAGYSSTGTITPKWHIGVDLLSVAYTKKSVDKWTDSSLLENKRVSWLRGYDFDTYGIVPKSVKRQELNQIKSGIKKLASGRTDFLIDYDKAILKIIKEEELGDKIDIFSNVLKGPKYYMIFADTPKGKALAKIWDDGMEQLNKSGKLQAMYKAAEDPAY